MGAFVYKKTSRLLEKKHEEDEIKEIAEIIYETFQEDFPVFEMSGINGGLDAALFRDGHGKEII